MIDTTLQHNYEEPDVVQSSGGSWNGCSAGRSCAYTYQFRDCKSVSGTMGTGCTDIGPTPQCSRTTATTCNYTLTRGDVGDYIVSLVTASDGTGTSTPVASPAVGPVVASRLNTFCNVSTAYTNLTTGPHLCGWPDSTNTGYRNAPGYTGTPGVADRSVLTPASAGSSACPTVPQSNHTYSFCLCRGIALPANLTNVAFYGDDFDVTAPQNANVTGGSGDTGITFEYDTFQPNVQRSPVSCSQSYQYGIYNEGGQMKGYTVEYSDFWGFGNAIDTSGSSQAAPQVFEYNWIHDSSTTGGCGYHNDGIGMLNNGTEDYAVVDHNTIESIGNTNGIAWQNGTYSHDSDTNNLLSGWNEAFAGGRCASSCTGPTYITVTGNVFSTYLAIEGDYPIDNATAYLVGDGVDVESQLLGGAPGSGLGHVGV